MKITTQNLKLSITQEQIKEVFEDDLLELILISMNNAQVKLNQNGSTSKQMTIRFEDVMDIIEKETNPLAAMLDIYDYFSGIGWCMK